MLSTRLIPILIAIAFIAAMFGWLAFVPPKPKPNLDPAQAAPGAPPMPAGPGTIATDKGELMQGAGDMDADAPTDFSQTPSGLKYRILRKSDGPKPNAANTVTVNYRGWLDNGMEFDSSYGRGAPATFPLGRVIAGWTEGLQLVGTGGMIELMIPPQLGYGAGGAPGGKIPPNSQLHFIVELIEIQ